MIPQRGRTIQIYLPSGEPRGIRMAEITTRTVQTILIPQGQLRHAKNRPELDQVAVYFLFGEPDEDALPLCYIGQTEDVSTRLDRHSAEKDFWNTAVVAISKTQSFTPAHIRWLEWHCVRQATAAGRFQLDNSQNPREPFVTEPLQDDCLDAFETLSILLTALGFPLFEPLVASPAEEAFVVKGPDAEGKGVLTDEGFLVRKGSLCRKQITESAKTTVEAARNRLFASGVLQEHNDTQLIFASDHLFRTPSGAAIVVLGRSVNGWAEWKTEDGKTLHEVKRAEPMSEPKS